jgi:hypothetical protein
MKKLQQNSLKLKLEYGEPQISTLEVEDEIFKMQILVPGTVERSLIIVADNEKLMVEHEVDDRFVPKFKFFLYSEDINFKAMRCEKDDGVLTILAPVNKHNVNSVITRSL